MNPLDWITLVVGIAAYSLVAYTFYHCFFDKPGGHRKAKEMPLLKKRA